MHEMSIALAIMDVVSEEAERRGARGVGEIHLKLGPLSGVLKDALVSAYELAREGSPLAGTRLVVEDVPIVVFCPQCNARRPVVSPQEICCVECGTPTPTIISGRELEVVAMEVLQ
jgi:hydrogenase nickel incorporation protein HypA/HybF